jgi:predicted ATPase
MRSRRTFISYSTKDASAAAELCTRLEASGVPCWIAPRDITPGRDWSAEIPPAVDACKAMVLVLSASANASRQIAHEVHLAHNAGATIVPFRIEAVKPEGALRYLLSGIHYVNAFDERRGRGLEELAALLAGLDAGVQPPALLPLRGGEYEAPRARRTNLPLQLTSFIARDAEIERLSAQAANSRLLALVGTGGVGKTRIALALAHALQERYDGGVWFVDLSLIEASDAVASAAAAALSIRPAPGQTAAEALAEGVGDRSLLLVFDGCDRVREAAAALVDALLRSCPHAAVVATSRQALGVAGEVSFNVEPLDSPGAVALFAERARAVSPTFAITPANEETIARVCRRLDGIPLGIELAAAKMRVIGPAQLDEKLDERFRILTTSGHGRLPRQQTLRATIDWSFDLLDDRERGLFRRLAVFSGGCTLQAASAVCGEREPDEWETLEYLSSLVEKSLVTVESFGEEQRYGMLNSIREYALERLAQAGESEEIAARHARCYAAFVHGLAPLVLALDDVEWSRRFAPELANVRAVIEWSIFEERAPEIGRQMLTEIEWPELVTTPQEALGWFERAAAGCEPNSLVQSRLLRRAALLEWLVGRPLAEREQSALRALDAARATGDANEIAGALANLGACYRWAGRFEDADAAFTQAYETPELLTPITAKTVLRLWAVTHLQRGDVEAARRLFSEVARLERPGSEGHASALVNLGELEFACGNVAAARDAARSARETFARLNSVYLVPSLSNLAAYALAADDIEEARDQLRIALQALGGASSAWLYSVLENHALLAALLGDRGRGAALAAFTDAHYTARGEVRQHTERRAYERLATLLAQAHDAEELAARASEGAGLTAEQALALAAAIHASTTN